MGSSTFFESKALIIRGISHGGTISNYRLPSFLLPNYLLPGFLRSNVNLIRSMLVLSCLLATTSVAQDTQALKENLGRQLYFDKNLSFNRTQSCATCHDPSKGFVDARDNHVKGTASLGDNGLSIGYRNAPTTAYANQIPPFDLNHDGHYVGGQFWDGRASTLIDQAKGPPLNPIEMGMPDKPTLIKRLQNNEAYVTQFNQVYGKNILGETDAAFTAMAEAIAAFEKTAFFAPFDSRYDRYLRGEYQMTEKEELGMTLFFSKQFTNCNQCHQLKQRAMAAEETFSSYRYHNIGVPVNIQLRALNGAALNDLDEGLFEHPDVNDTAHRGKFRVPSLRNVAMTGPYMHNGVFKDLRTVVSFYNKYNSKRQASQINPESGEPWASPEIADNLSLKELQHGPALDEKRIDALVSFMRTLTDARFEHLLN